MKNICPINFLSEVKTSQSQLGVIFGVFILSKKKVRGDLTWRLLMVWYQHLIHSASSPKFEKHLVNILLCCWVLFLMLLIYIWLCVHALPIILWQLNNCYSCCYLECLACSNKRQRRLSKPTIIWKWSTGQTYFILWPFLSVLPMYLKLQAYVEMNLVSVITAVATYLVLTHLHIWWTTCFLL